MSGGAGLLGRRAECAALDRLLADARAGQCRVVVLRGEAGIGKTALLEYLIGRASDCRVARVAGVESERELAFAGLHQLCAPFLDRVERLPGPQRDAFGTAFGLSAGPAPDRFLVGLAVLTLLAEVAEDEPLVCVVDDAQWLDRVSAQTLAFAARRLLAERIALVFGVREPEGEPELVGLPELIVRGLAEADARALLDSVVRGPVDGRVRDRIIAETAGNPLALQELPRTWTSVELADGFDRADGVGLAGRIEQGFLRQLDPLPADTRLLLLTAAAEPLGDAGLLWPAAGRLGLGADPAAAAAASGLIEFGPRIRFRHPLVRSALYRSASAGDRQRVHRALAEVTDPDTDPDRRAWHLAQATVTPDEDVAVDLERSAGRAQARGGMVAAAAFLEQAALLTPDPDRRAARELAAARAKRDAGALDAALGLLAAVEVGPPDAVRAAEVEHLRGQIAFDQRRGSDAARLLLHAAARLAPLDAGRARETYLEALGAALWAAGSDATGLREAAEAARAAPAAQMPPRAVDLVLDALVTRFTEGYPAAAPLLGPALAAVRDLDTGSEEVGRVLWLLGNRAGGTLATEAWDFECARGLATRQVQLAREVGALVQLQFALNFLAINELLAGDLAGAAAAVEEDRRIAEVTGNPPVGYTAMAVAAFRGEATAAEQIAATAQAASGRGQHRLVSLADWATAVLSNGLGRHDAARDAARRVFDADIVGYQMLAAAELAEAASRTGDEALLAAVAAQSAERARLIPTDWSVGIAARLRALCGTGVEADRCYRESIEALGRTALRVDLARSHLLYGEWLRREGHRVQAREHLRTAHDALSEMGLAAFAERAGRELSATGETVRKRSAPVVDEQLTAQEFQIARLARDGLSNPEIGTRLYLSPRTVEWHLRKIFTKLGISSRRQLRDTTLAVT
ncbi:MAG TPA: AAA family ATPase [Actinophytocola sp.]|uniref:helix-turn-helix transcriptional regulator n=1 Tax=Actinophytocola sp. TaxID=1872138 RepID=UPI002DB58C82|nr:AAA family ATPase [Actinophytocola sp.]HEU5469276.1 AAA family ATPase [Actinophytocola sp.]